MPQELENAAEERSLRLLIPGAGGCRGLRNAPVDDAAGISALKSWQGLGYAA